METKIGETTLPQDHEEQLALGHRIIHGAFHGHKGVLENEIRSLRVQVEEYREKMGAMQKKNSALEVELVESHQRSQQLAEENKELFKTVGSLRKQIGRLEHLKAAVMSSIQDDHEKEAEFGDSRAVLSDQYINTAVPLTASAMGIGNGFQPPQYGSNTPLAPTPLQMQGGQSPAPRAATIDGKAFFREARGRLSGEAFNQFLASIKKLNNQQQSREETLNEARNLFGFENNDLYVNFENLLNSQAAGM
jgi:hypothetical protein